MLNVESFAGHDHVNIVKAEPISNHVDMTGCNQSCKRSLTHTTDNLKTAYHFLFFAVLVKRRHVVVFHSRQVRNKENGGQQLLKNLCNKTLTSSLGLKRGKKKIIHGDAALVLIYFTVRLQSGNDREGRKKQKKTPQSELSM